MNSGFLQGLREQLTLRRFAQIAVVTAVLLPGLAACLSAADDYSNLPPCVDNTCNCGDFASRDLAQLVFDSFKEDYYSLDRDGNGQACESLPQVDLSLERATYFSNNEHLIFGNPSNAGKDNPNNWLMEREQYVLSYGRDRNLINWASWWVDDRWLGQTDRQDDFRPDGGLPKGFYQATPGEYRRSGYDRGHLVPSGDRTANPRDNSLTFLMTNIFPQASENNRGPWRALESYGRDLVYQQGKVLYVIAGVYGDKGSVGKVTVPGRVWKVIVVLNSIEHNIGRGTEVIAVDMPNSDRIEADWQLYRTTVDRIEIATGYDLLSEVPTNIQSVIESR